jgi:hypothetical protein
VYPSSSTLDDSEDSAPDHHYGNGRQQEPDQPGHRATTALAEDAVAPATATEQAPHQKVGYRNASAFLTFFVPVCKLRFYPIWAYAE